MKYFSLFSGIGGFELGIQKAIPEAQCIGYSEVNKYAIKIYEKHFSTHQNWGDATRIVTDKFPDFDILVAGFPCQAFSVAGKRRGFNDSRGTLFFEIARILRDKRPRYFLLENVKGLLSHQKGETFQTIIRILADLGYAVEWEVLNSKHFGVPQNRERVFIIGYLGKECCPKVFPLRKGDGLSQEESPQWISENGRGIAGSLTASYHKGVRSADRTLIKEKEKVSNTSDSNNQVIIEINTGHQGNTVYSPKGIASTLNSLGGGQGGKTGLYAMRGREEGQQLEYRGDETNALTGIQKDNLWVEVTEPSEKLVASNGKEIDLSESPEGYFQLAEARTEQGKLSRKIIRKEEGRDSTARGKDDKKYIPRKDGIANCLTTSKDVPEKLVVKAIRTSGDRDKQKTYLDSEVGALSANPMSDVVPKILQRSHGYNKGGEKDLPCLRQSSFEQNDFLLNNCKIRRLTPIECERLQGFPDRWSEGISDTQRYKCLGNAVTVNVIEAIFKRWIKSKGGLNEL